MISRHGSQKFGAISELILKCNIVLLLSNRNIHGGGQCDQKSEKTTSTFGDVTGTKLWEGSATRIAKILLFWQFFKFLGISLTVSLVFGFLNVLCFRANFY